MNPRPFAGLAPAQNRDHATWIVDAMHGRDGVANVVPDVFDACVRICHPLRDESRWAVVAPSYLRRGLSPYEYPFPEEIIEVEGDLTVAGVDKLVVALGQESASSQRCHFGLWNGWGDLHPGSMSSPLEKARLALEARGLRTAEINKAQETYRFVESCPVQPWWGGRTMLLFDGPLDGVRSIGSVRLFDDELHRRSPQWWWPEDRSWFVGTEIDYPWTYVAGSLTLIDRIHDNIDLETVLVQFEDGW